MPRYGGVWPGAIYRFLGPSGDAFDLYLFGLFLINVALVNHQSLLLYASTLALRGEAAQRRVFSQRKPSRTACSTTASWNLTPPCSLYQVRLLLALYVLFLSIASVLIAVEVTASTDK